MKSAPNTLLKSSCASWASFSWCATNSSHSRDFLLARLNPPAVLSNARDRKSTRLNSSHSQISYAVFCLKKKIEHERPPRRPGAHLRPAYHCYHLQCICALVGRPSTAISRPRTPRLPDACHMPLGATAVD